MPLREFPTRSAGIGRRGTRIPKEPASNRLLLCSNKKQPLSDTLDHTTLLHGRRRAPH